MLLVCGRARGRVQFSCPLAPRASTTLEVADLASLQTWVWGVGRFASFFLAALGLRCCAQAFSSCRERGLLFVMVRGLLIAVVSLAAEHGL